jgi:hypothetical protein
MAENEVERILKDMEKQGFPLEVKTSEILKTRNWEVTNQAAYLDIEKGKHRTVDIVAEKNVSSEPNRLAFDVWLVAECKRSTKPWVFYSSDFDLNNEETRRKFVSSSQFSLNSFACQTESHNSVTVITNEFLFKRRLASPIFGKIGNASFEPFTDGKGMSIHKAQMQVCSAILYLDKQLDSMTDVTESPYGIYFVPIIVVDGKLYTYENKKVRPTEGLYYYATFYDSAFMIEILTIDFLERYLDVLERNIRDFK